MITIHKGHASWFRRYLGWSELTCAWCVGEPEGFVAMRDMDCIGVAFTTVDQFGRTWLWFDQQLSLSAVCLHRRGVRFLDDLKARGQTVHVFIDPREPGAERWARRCGFQPHGVTTHPNGSERMAWRRI